MEALTAGEALQSLYRSAHEERHEAQPGAVVARPEFLLVLAPQRHHRRHIHLVERGEHGRIVLGFHKPARDAGAQPGHGYAAFDPFSQAIGVEFRRHRWLRHRHRLGRLGYPSRGRRGRPFLLDELRHIVLGDAPVPAGTLHPSDVQPLLLGELTRRGAGAHRLGLARRGILHRNAGRGHLARLQGRQQLLAANDVALLLDDTAKVPVGGSNHLQNHLVCFDVNEQFVAPHRRPRTLVPDGNGALGNGFREGWRFYVHRSYPKSAS